MPHTEPGFQSVSPSGSTTLHITLLTSHYLGANEVDEVVTVSGSSAGHKKEVANVKALAPFPKATGKEKEPCYVCTTASEQLDSVARVLCTALQHDCSPLVEEQKCTDRGEDHIVSSAHRVQVAKAVRDGALPWSEIAVALGKTGLSGAYVGNSFAPYGDMRLKLSTSSLLSDPPELSATTAAAAASVAAGAATKPNSRTSSRGRSGGSGGASRQRALSTSSRRASALPATLQNLTDVESRQCQAFLESQLPSCEVVGVPMAPNPGDHQGTSTPSSSPSCPVFFLYHLLHEEDVVAAVCSIATATPEATGNDIGAAAAERERRRARANKVAGIVTRAVWCTLRPALRSYLHRTGSTSVPSHLSVVWAAADPRLLEGLNSHTGKDADEAAVFFPCTSTMSVAGSAGDCSETIHAEPVDRWVQLVPRSAVYLYDPASLAAPGSASVEAALAALQADRTPEEQRGIADGVPPKAGHRRGSADGGMKPAQGQRGNQAASSFASAQKAPRANGAAAGSVATSKGRNGNGKGDGSLATHGATTAVGESLAHALVDQVDAVAQVNFDADPFTFPYCAADATSLACYLYAGCDMATGGALPATLPRDQRGKAVTSFLRKASSYRRAVQAASTTSMLANSKSASSLRVTADVLSWIHVFFSLPSVTTAETTPRGKGDVATLSSAVAGIGKRSLSPDAAALADVASGSDGTDYATVLSNVVKASLEKGGLDAIRWPIPLWMVTTVPLATVPPLPLRCGGSGSSTSAGRAGKDGSAASPESDALATLTTWASSWKGDRAIGATGTSGPQDNDAAGLLQQMARLGKLVGAYANWTVRSVTARSDGTAPRSRRARENTEKVEITHFTPDAYTNGVFTAIHGAAALMAEADRSLARQITPRPLTAVCAAVDVEDSAHALADEHASPPPSSKLFHRYKEPFQRLAHSHDNCGGAVDAAVVPRGVPATANAKAVRCAVTAATTSNDADVVLPPYPQEVAAMVRHIVAKNAGHFEVNTTRGTDTITTASAGGTPSAMVDNTMTGSLFPATRQTTLNTTTQSTGLLLRQQQQQQRRRQRGQGGSIAASLRPYVHSVRLIKEVGKATLGRRPNTEAAVLVQEALEATLATPPDCGAGSNDVHGREQAASPDRRTLSNSGISREWEATVNALELLQRYLGTVPASPLRGITGAPSTAVQEPLSSSHGGVAKKNDGVLAAANAAAAAAQALTPRVYEHCIQQILLHQLLRESGLEQVPWQAPGEREGQDKSEGDWSVTEQIPTETIVPTLVDFRERFGAHNVAVNATTLDYQGQSTISPFPAFSTSHVAGAAKQPFGVAKEAAEVHRTSAYAHNALNVHPTRRVTQLWTVGVALPRRPEGESSEEASRRIDSKQGGVALFAPYFTRCRTRKWVEMVPRAGMASSMELYAVWWSLLVLLKAGQNEEALSTLLGKAASPLTAESSKTSLTLTFGLACQLLKQYMQRRAESSTALVRTDSTAPAAPSEAATVSVSPMRFTTHETLHPYGDALLEVWSGEAQRTCRYIRATEVTAALHAGVRTPNALSSPLHLSVRWDDGLLFSCNTTGAQHSTSVPSIDVQVATSNFVLQRCSGDARLLLRRYPNTSSCATASGIAAAHESSGQPQVCPPQGLLNEVCSTLFEARTTVNCVHDCLPQGNWSATTTEAPIAMIETSLEEAEVSCEVDERTGVVRRAYPSGVQLLQFPSGATLARYPANASVGSKQLPSAQRWCETLVTCDGRCFVRCINSTEKKAATSTLAQPTTEPTSPASRPAAEGVFRRVVPLLRRDGHSPPFTRAESTYDAVRHCHVRSRQDGLTVVEYSSLAKGSADAGHSGATLARVVVFPDGTSITTLAPRDVRHHALFAGSRSHSATAKTTTDAEARLSAAAALSSPSLCALLEEVQAVESGLFGPCVLASAAEVDEEAWRGALDDVGPSVRWLVEAPALPRLYIAASDKEENAAFAAVFGDGTVLQRHWVQSAIHAAPNSQRPRGSCTAAAYEEPLSNSATTCSTSTPAALYKGGTVATVLIRPSTSAVRLLHQHAVATIEPVDVLASITRTSAAAYAVGQGLPFFDLAHGGGMRLVDAARCVWEVRSLAAASGPKVIYPDHTRTYKELLRDLVSTNYSPHRLPRAAALTYANDERREALLYAQQRSTGWCPPLVRRLRELAEPYIRTANLLRTDILAPMEAAAASVSAAVQSTVGDAQSSSSYGSHDASAQSVATIRPLCFGQLANGESIRYWCAKDVVLPSHTGEGSPGASCAASEPHVLQRVVPFIAVGGVLRYTSSAPLYPSAAEVVAFLSTGHRGGTGNDYTALRQRLAAAQRLSLLCVGGLAPAIPPALEPSTTPFSSSTAWTCLSSLPPLAARIANGCRWLPPTMQPPQQFSSANNKSVQHAIAAQSDVVWALDAATATAGSAYVQYAMERIDTGTPAAMLRAAVARRELHRHEELAQLSHYHRVLTAQWPMEPPRTAREEQARLEMRCNELQRARHLLFTEDARLFEPTVPGDANTSRRKHPESRLAA